MTHKSLVNAKDGMNMTTVRKVDLQPVPSKEMVEVQSKNKNREEIRKIYRGYYMDMAVWRYQISL